MDPHQGTGGASEGTKNLRFGDFLAWSFPAPAMEIGKGCPSDSLKMDRNEAKLQIPGGSQGGFPWPIG